MKIRSRMLLLAGGLVAAGSLVFALSVRATDDVVVAKSDVVTLRASDLKTLLGDLDPAAQQRLRQQPDALSGVLKQELGRRVLVHEAQDKGWDKRPQVQAMIARARDEVIASSYLQSVAAPPEAYPSADELAQAYKLNQDKFMQPRRYQLAQIYLAVPAGTDPQSATAQAQQAKAQKIAREVKAAPQRFADIARSDSDDKNSAAKGGDLGWAPESQIVPAIKTVVTGLGKGEISDPILAADGWHIVRLLDTRPAAPAALAEVSDQLRQLLRQQRARQSAAAYVSKLESDEHIAVDEIGLQKVATALVTP
jgi:peptidylprolyl isomerase